MVIVGIAMFQLAKSWIGYLFLILFAFICSAFGIYLLSRFDDSTRLFTKKQKEFTSWSNLDFDCPPWINNKVFIEEVRYLSNLGDLINVHEPEITEKISRALKKHPWVNTVQDIQRTKHRTFSAKVDFKKPVAMISLIEPSNLSKNFRAIDIHGDLLPKDCPILNLILIVPEITLENLSSPQSQRKKDLREIARLVGFLNSEGNLFANMLVEMTKNGIEFRSVSGHINCLWGMPTQDDRKGNQAKVAKFKNILKNANQPGFNIKIDLSIQDPK